MLTKLLIRDFKRFEEVEIELGDPVVFIGPNDSGKTTALQALALWDLGLKRWNEKRSTKETPAKRSGVVINRKDLLAVPVPNAIQIWRDLHVRRSERANGKTRTENICVEIVVEGTNGRDAWTCGLEFDYANTESFYCRPLRRAGSTDDRMPIPEAASKVKMAYLPPMSGLAANETRLDQGAINVRLGEGRTAEVLRNLCYQLSSTSQGAARWPNLVKEIQRLFGVTLDEPEYIVERGEVVMNYKTKGGVRLDLSSSGRGMQQTLLLLAHLANNPGCVLLLDEPDAHLEILRQRQIFELVSMTAAREKCQVVMASHSEVVLQEAAEKGTVVAFVGKPHRIQAKTAQVAKALKDIGYDDYLRAEVTGWVLYLEGSTDISILHAFATRLKHPVAENLASPFCRYVANDPQKARDHFHGLKEAKPDLVGFLLFDRLERELTSTDARQEYMWRRREIENYLCQPATLLAYAESIADEIPNGLFDQKERDANRQAMKSAITRNVIPAALEDPYHEWWSDAKASDKILDPIFRSYEKTLGFRAGEMNKSKYYQLVDFIPADQIPDEVIQVLDQIRAQSLRAKPGP